MTVPPEDRYVSSRRAKENPRPWWDQLTEDRHGRLRDSNGRFVPKFNGQTCDRIGCGKKIEAPRSRFCAEHRREHGQMLLGQLNAVVAQHRAAVAKHRGEVS